jgi:hypothetical protein
MAKRLLLALSHSIEEHDQLELLHSLGYEVASIGGYIDPAHPHDPKRPPLPQVPCVEQVKQAVDSLATSDNLGLAQSEIPQPILDWLGPDGVIIFHHRLERLFGQWRHLAEWRAGGGRVIWRTVGQSVEHNERQAHPYRADGLEIVRYSPKERNIPGYAGEDALIRFWKDADEWAGWTGEEQVVVNVTQDLFGRHPYTNYDFWADATRGLATVAIGPHSERCGGAGELELGEMQAWLRRGRCYLYTGTQPASYTLGLLEALMTGIPVVSIGPEKMSVFPYGPELFEGHELACLWSDEPQEANRMLRNLLGSHLLAADYSREQRERAIATFGRDVAARAWRDYLGEP